MEPQTALSRLVARFPSESLETHGLRPWARQHGLAGLLACELEAGRIVLPEEEAAGIVADWQGERRWAAVLDLELERIPRAAVGLPAPILLKGPAVAQRYADPAVRNYVDIDLLLPHRSVEPWAQALESLGYRRPSEWAERRARFHHHLGLRRPVGERDVLCELHWCLFVERRALGVTYEALRPYARPSTFDGVLWLDDAAQLVVLALHLAKHRVEGRRMIWYRDFVEIGREDVVTAARGLALSLGVGWAVEQALFDTERILGEPVWEASPETHRRFGMALLADTEGAAYLRPLALARELGLRDWIGYMGNLLDPRRFVGPDGRFELQTFWTWVKTMVQGLKAVRLRRLWNRRRRP